MTASLHPDPLAGPVWITGASSGIGRAVAEQLRDRGFTVAVTARDAEALAALAAAPARNGGRIVACPGDVTDAPRMADIVAAIEGELGPLSLAILNAGVYIPVAADAPLTVAPFETSFAVNLNGTVNALVPVLNLMRPRRRGHIVVVASVAGYSGLPTSAAYGATKAGLINLAESLKFDLDTLGIRIQLVSPGFVDTPATKNNPFPMPHLMQVDDAAAALIDGLSSDAFEITFPRRFTWQLKLLRMLPYSLYFRLIARSTGWDKRGR
jgi:NAD(P)-dependent dehydrogenase (short-subunit alcohol dehydrogenase family)